MQVDFYHLAGTPIERVLPRIAERVLGAGGRLLVVSSDEVVLARLDEALWRYAPESFLPHARVGGEGDADQPLLLAAGPEPLNAAGHVALVDGVWRDEALGFERAFHFFADDALPAARAAWRALGDREGVERRFWKQDENGRWSQA